MWYSNIRISLWYHHTWENNKIVYSTQSFMIFDWVLPNCGWPVRTGVVSSFNLKTCDGTFFRGRGSVLVACANTSEYIISHHHESGNLSLWFFTMCGTMSMYYIWIVRCVVGWVLLVVFCTDSLGQASPNVNVTFELFPFGLRTCSFCGTYCILRDCWMWSWCRRDYRVRSHDWYA